MDIRSWLFDAGPLFVFGYFVRARRGRICLLYKERYWRVAGNSLCDKRKRCGGLAMVSFVLTQGFPGGGAKWDWRKTKDIPKKLLLFGVFTACASCSMS
jgi:hypothetical protein